MKKLILMLLLVVGGVNVASAAEELYLHNSNNDWGSYPAFTNKGTNEKEETMWEYILNSNTGLGNDDFYFRLKYSDFNDDLGPYNHEDYTFVFNGDNSNQWETYTIKHSDPVWGSTGAFKIEQSSIKASEYKITVYAKKNDVYYLKVDIVSMPATVSSAGYATFSCDRALDLSDVPAYYASDVSNGKVVLSKTTGKVPAGTGLLLVGQGDYNIPVVATSDATAINGNLLIGTPNGGDVAASTNGSYNYMLANTNGIGFYNVASATTSGAGKAYLHTDTKLANESGVGSRAAWLFQEDETTGIHAVQNSENVDVIYDLQGRVAKNGKAGLYIKNGKKFFVK